MKKYLICSRDDSVVHVTPHCVVATSTEAALERYLREVYALDAVFRESVLDLCVNMTFVERFYLSTTQEATRFDITGEVGTETEIVRSRVRAYFAARPDLGDIFIRYMDSEDQVLIDDEMFAFIAVTSPVDEHGFVAVDIEALELLA